MTLREQVVEALRQVIDPELGINIIDLGLVYGIDVQPDAQHIEIRFTMTTAACPLGPYLVREIEHAVHSVAPAPCTVNVDVVWEPAWSPELMSDHARESLGWT